MFNIVRARYGSPGRMASHFPGVLLSFFVVAKCGRDGALALSSAAFQRRNANLRLPWFARVPPAATRAGTPQARRPYHLTRPKKLSHFFRRRHLQTDAGFG